MEQIVAAFRAKRELPDYQAELKEIKSQCADSEAAALKSKEEPESNSKKSRKNKPEGGAYVFKATFSPSRELSAKNVNINSIREQLAQAGEIIKSTPVVIGKGNIIFEFIVATKQDLENRKEWEARGVTIELVEQHETASQAAAEQTYNPFLAPSHFVRVDLKRQIGRAHV